MKTDKITCDYRNESDVIGHPSDDDIEWLADHGVSDVEVRVREF